MLRMESRPVKTNSQSQTPHAVATDRITGTVAAFRVPPYGMSTSTVVGSPEPASMTEAYSQTLALEVWTWAVA